MKQKIYLASASPRRADLLNQIDLDFEVYPSSIDEHVSDDLSAEETAVYLAKCKAHNVAERLDDGLVIGADTIVVSKEKILGKPHNSAEAKEMLSMLSGSKHLVITGLAVENIADRITITDRSVTEVWFRKLSPGEIERYVATGEPFDKAGGYGIQGKGALLVDKISGCYFNVVGLPVSLLSKMLEAFGYQVLDNLGGG